MKNSYKKKKQSELLISKNQRNLNNINNIWGLNIQDYLTSWNPSRKEKQKLISEITEIKRNKTIFEENILSELESKILSIEYPLLNLEFMENYQKIKGVRVPKFGVYKLNGNSLEVFKFKVSVSENFFDFFLRDSLKDQIIGSYKSILKPNEVYFEEQLPTQFIHHLSKAIGTQKPSKKVDEFPNWIFYNNNHQLKKWWKNNGIIKSLIIDNIEAKNKIFEDKEFPFSSEKTYLIGEMFPAKRMLYSEGPYILVGINENQTHFIDYFDTNYKK